MDYLIWGGAIISLIGMAGIIFSLVSVIRARREAKSDDDLRARLGRFLPINLGSLFLSVIGLMCVVLGVMLS